MKNFKIYFAVLLVALVGLVVNVGAAEYVLNPIADTYIRDGGSAQENYGRAPFLELKWESERDGMTRVALITFDISSIKSVERAKIRLFAEWVDVLDVRELAVFDITGFGWDENQVTWNDVSLEDGSLITFLDVPSIENIWHEIDVTEQLQAQVAAGSSTFSVRIENLSDDWGGLVRFTSKEGADAPQLVIID